MLVPFTLASAVLLASSAPIVPFENHSVISKYGAPNTSVPFPITKDLGLVKSPDVKVWNKKKEPRFICRSCNDNESRTLAFLQDRGVTDKNALATIMGNIRQESTFVPDICEGGSRPGYHNCGGGFGLIQWTNAPRYYGLGRHAKSIGACPSSLHAQLSYLVSESDWKMVEHRMKAPGRSIESYMSAARDWIRWGHHGARTSYAYNYAQRISLA